MIAIRYKKLKSGNYSVYLDICVKDEKGQMQRSYDFLNIYVSRDYSKSKRILQQDEEKIELVRSIRSKRELEMYGTIQGLDTGRRVNISLLDYVWDSYEKTSRKNYRFFHGHLKKFSRGKDILFSDVTTRFLNRFKDYLLESVGQNTMVLYVSIFHKFMSEAFKKELISWNPFDHYQMPSRFETDHTFLELHELQKLQDTETDFEPHIREAFFFSCFTGLRFSDVSTLEYAHFLPLKDKEGKEYLSLRLRPIKTSRTTGDVLRVPLSDEVLHILSRMKKSAVSSRVFYLLPGIATCNKCLKEWAKRAGVNKNLHFHVGRHTFATLSLTCGIDIYTVSKLLGHSRIDSTEIYAKVIDEKKRQEVQKFPVFFERL
jgi:integrase